MPSSTRWRSPCASCPTGRAARSPRSSRSSASATAPSAPCRPSTRNAASQMFSRTDSPSMTLGTCVLMPMPSRAISCGCQPVVSWPSIRISPALGVSMPARHLKNVLLPAPFGPIRQRSSSRRRKKSTPSTALTPPNRMVTPRVSSTMSAIGASPGRARTVPRGPPGPAPARQAGPLAERRHDAARQKQHRQNQNQAEHERVVDQRLLAEREF